MGSVKSEKIGVRASDNVNDLLGIGYEALTDKDGNWIAFFSEGHLYACSYGSGFDGNTDPTVILEEEVVDKSSCDEAEAYKLLGEIGVNILQHPEEMLKSVVDEIEYAVYTNETIQAIAMYNFEFKIVVGMISLMVGPHHRVEF